MLESAFRFAEAMHDIQLFGAAGRLLGQLRKDVAWSCLHELRALSHEHYRRYQAAHADIATAAQVKESECAGPHPSKVPGRSLLLDDDSIEIWLNGTKKWVPAVTKDVVLQTGIVQSQQCDSRPTAMVPGTCCFKINLDSSNDKEVWLHPNVLPQPGEAVAPPCANASAEALSLFVRQTTDFYKDAANSWMELDKSYSAAATAQTVQTIYQPKEIPPSFVARHADDHTKILNDFSTLGFAVVSDGLPDGWDSQMRDYLLQFRSRLSSQAWDVSPEFRGHTTYYMKKPGMRTNLALSKLAWMKAQLEGKK